MNYNPNSELREIYCKCTGEKEIPGSLDRFNEVMHHQAINWSYSSVSATRENIAEEFLKRNYQTCLEFGFVPMFSDSLMLCIATTEPWNETMRKDILRAFNVKLKVLGVPEHDFEELKILCYKIFEEHQAEQAEQSKDAALKQSVSSWVFNRAQPRLLLTTMLTHAFSCDASDIHLDVLHDRVRVRYRVNGEFENQAPIEREFAADVMRVFKGFCRIPSDAKTARSGSGRLEIEGNPIDFRGEFQPSAGGGAFVLRILDNTKWNNPVWRQLPFSGEDLSTVQRILSKENGLILVTGPTGSGKTTTLLRFLLSLEPETKSIRTIEHPVEYQLPNVTHVGVFESDEPAIPSFGFKDGIRSHMRADPDVILVGEIRDPETADAALDGALTGHLLLSTLHTMDTVSSIERIIELGVNPWRLQSTLRLVVAQRLVPILCKSCKTPLPIQKEMRKDFEEHEIDVPEFHYVADGCADCSERGTFGRTAIFEILDLSGELGELARPDSLVELRKKWISSGARTLFHSALELAARGEIAFRTALAFKGKASK